MRRVVVGAGIMCMWLEEGGGERRERVFFDGGV
jgi:hypothetical protein